MSARNPQKIWRVIDLLKWGEQYFSDNSFDNPKKEIELLIQEILNCSRVDLYLRFEEPLERTQLTKLREWVQRRKTSEPIQYITGKAGFYNLIVKVTPDVLIPRPESERIVDILIEGVDKDTTISILDIGTGSGCLALAIAKELPNTKITGVDNSEKSIELAKLNAENLEIKNVNFLQIDFLIEDIGNKYDMIISNPPYIPESEMDSLMPDVKNFEPYSALTDSADGLTFYRVISKKCDSFLKSKGWIFLEVGLGKHPKKVKELFINEKFKNVELINDYNGAERILKAQFV